MRISIFCCLDYYTGPPVEIFYDAIGEIREKSERNMADIFIVDMRILCGKDPLFNQLVCESFNKAPIRSDLISRIDYEKPHRRERDLNEVHRVKREPKHSLKEYHRKVNLSQGRRFR